MSWELTSAISPPDRLTSHAHSGGSPGPRPVDRTRSGSPMSPAAMRSAARTKPPSNRRMNAMRNCPVDRSAARTIRAASSSVLEIGFLQSTCLSASRARTATSAWMKVGAAMTAASMPSAPAASIASVNVRSTPSSLAAAASACSSGSATATRRAPRTPEAKLRAWTMLARPAPTRATLSSEFILLPSPPGHPAPAPLIDRDDHDDDRAADDALPEIRDAQDVQTVGQDAHDEHTDDGAADPTLATEQRGTTDDDRRDGVELGAAGHECVRTVQPAGEHHPADAGKQP